ncbi:polyketide synthase [Pedobacter nyackensis]|uniref:polyketide synthase n=1 Tax=Pedobacter nyackensis TaxID=475255 RepID=UPI00292FB37E|nr:polyketide synthase [Pedobacter nyackensis]
MINKNSFIYLFAEQVERIPNNIAIVCKDSKLSYIQLEEKSNQIANFLLKKGVNKTTTVGIYLDRSIELLTTILGVLKTGASYVPLDPIYPQDRIDFMLEDSGASILINSTYFKEQFNTPAEIIYLEKHFAEIELCDKTAADVTIEGTDVAYILYTSGSTGKPKGVQIEHYNLLNFLLSMKKEPGLVESDFFLANTTISFDIAAMEIFLPLIVGAKILMVDSELRLDLHKILSVIEEQKVTVMQATPTTWRLMIDAGWKNKLSLKVLCGGEAFPQDLANQLLNLSDEVWNVYGPTETTIWSTIKKISRNEKPISVGKPIDNTQIYILGEDLQRLLDGEIGEICIGGHGVARGYLNRPELNQERFLKDTFSNIAGAKIYRTGDLGLFLPNGEIQCLGRMDDQVKIQGYRIELGEIENCISSFPNIKRCCVIVWEEKQSGNRLVGYIVSIENKSIDINELIEYLKKEMPEYMVPTVFVQLEVFPLTSNGKLDKKSLPPPVRKRSSTGTLYRAPTSTLEKNIITIWKSLLEIDQIGTDDNFFEIGGNSILAIKTVSILKNEYNITLPIIKLYQHPTANGISKIIGTNNSGQFSFEPLNSVKQKEVAIIGMAGRFPGADNINELWDVLTEGKETTKFFDYEELDKQIPDEEKNNKDYVRARGVINNPEWFDAELFDVTPTVAKLMDPQQRVFLEICREVLETTGHLSSQYDGITGVFSGSGTNDYYINNLLSNPDEIAKIGNIQVFTLNEKDYLSSRVAYHLDLKGPAVSVYSACSTSLLAIAQAVTAIRNNQCDSAIAGGISITTPVNSGHLYEEGAIFTDDGHCRPFDALGKGTVFSDGAAVVLLKDLELAKKDGDEIFAVIKGIGINNDGALKTSFTAPSTIGQAKVVAMAIHDAGIKPESISYIEAHGTATPIGDPIEIEGLKLAFGHQTKKQYCAIGSLKSNMGHLTHAAGAAGLIKTTLALYHKKIPASINYSQPNPNIDFVNSPFIVNDKLIDWQSDVNRIAGVSSFGIGGTNVHTILEEYPSASLKEQTKLEVPVLISWSAKSEKSIDLYADKLKDYISQNPEVNIADISYTLQTTRQNFNLRNYIVANNGADLLQKLQTKAWQTNSLTEKNNNLVFMFPGQGAQYINMGLSLYKNEKVYKDAIDECAELLLSELGEDIRKVIFSEESEEEASKKLKNTYYAQPAIFISEYALAKLWLSWGIEPTAYIGHSVGEYVAAHLSGVFSLPDALKLVASRGRLISKLASGSMLSIRESSEKIALSLPKGVSIAAINAPNLCVASGPAELIQSYAEELEKRGIKTALLHTSHAFHSEMMNPILNEFKEIVSSVPLNIVKKAAISTVTGDWMKDSEGIDPDYWVKHISATVRFSDGVKILSTELNPVFLEVGPGNVTATLTRQHGGDTISKTIGGLTAEGEYESILNALGKLWANDINLDWNKVYGKRRSKITNLPSYAYNRKYFWINSKQEKLPQLNSNIDTTVQTDVLPEEHDVKTYNEKEVIIERIKQILYNASGIEMNKVNLFSSFIEIGLDSLLLTQIAVSLKNEFNLQLTFRKLNEEYYNIDLLSSHILKNQPARSEPFNQPIKPPVSSLSETTAATDNLPIAIQLLTEQVTFLAKQITLLQQAADKTVNTNGTHPILQSEANHNSYNQNSEKEILESKNTPAPIKATNGLQLTNYFKKPPMKNARLGKDKSGNPAWFIPDEKNPGNFIQLELRNNI